MAQKGFRAKVQRFGSHLSGMIMPNIAAFIAWGLITALFIPDGYFPNEELASLVGPMINYLLPLLIGFTGGRLVYDIRGGVVGATATIGVIVGADIPMFLGAMAMGPLGGYLIKKLDDVFQDKIGQGFEMLYNNFSAGILGAVLAGISLKIIGPIINGITQVLIAGVEFLINVGLLPLANIIIEPAKVLFLNNAINHGILSPIAAEQSSETGKSILFLLETNPGPGLGVLLAFMVFGTGAARSSASGASIIHFFGGIHEIYFPYILMKPALLLAVIGGGVSGVFTYTIFNAGLTATPSPGSIVALMLMTPPGDHFIIALGVIVATLVSFLIASVILKASNSEGEDLSKATSQMEEMKGKKSKASDSLRGNEEQASTQQAEDVNKVVFACDAGMGSSAMGASLLKDKFKKADIEGIDVTNKAINDLTDEADIIITHKDLTDRAKEKIPSAEHISVENFLNSPKYDELVNRLKADE
ncbi:PTS family mannitol-permease II, BC component [Gracilibacillus halophilus YIM-C55.5]|uniref:PTS system mannitol-specific EIICB component n=1 Tax=Gracilibacillus halophilus YIM-C55.5 TaxID=1308866 RepID=N4WD07_9BACI|nr:PTS mannitol transporter subunit IICB [Gracilibacillus halophilus]ENH98168.1 PTS family mannitol-permease II, BC component [Gracilibacillus halophilus YIM-C55.5]